MTIIYSLSKTQSCLFSEHRHRGHLLPPADNKASLISWHFAGTDKTIAKIQRKQKMSEEEI